MLSVPVWFWAERPRELQRVTQLRCAVSFLMLIHSYTHLVIHTHNLVSVNWDAEMAHLIKAFDASPKDPRLIPGTHPVGGSNVGCRFNMKTQNSSVALLRIPIGYWPG